MKLSSTIIFGIALSLLLCSCATSSVKSSSKSAEYSGGQPKKVALLAVDDGIARTILEGQFVKQLEDHGTAAFRTHELMSLPEIKENKEAAAEKLREAGADSILIVRLVDDITRAQSVRQTSTPFVPTVTGVDTYGWYNCYSVAFMDMGVVRNSMKREVYLETSFYDLKTGQRIWSGLTKTVIKENTDKLAEVEPLVAKVLTAMRKDAVVK